MTATPRPTLERFIDAMQIAAGQRIDTPDLSSEGLRRVLTRLQRAAPIARTLVILANPLAGPGSDLVDAFTMTEADRARRERPDPLDPDDAAARACAETDAVYLLGICVGLQLADNV